MPSVEVDTPFWLKAHLSSGGWLTWLWPSMVIVESRNVAATARTSACWRSEHADGAADAGLAAADARLAAADASEPRGRAEVGTVAGALGRPGELLQAARTVTSRLAATAAVAVPRRRAVTGL